MKEEYYNHIYGQCKRYMHSYVLAELADGSTVDGIITGLDNENVYFAIPVGSEQTTRDQSEEQRQYGGGYGHYHGPGYGYSPGYGGYSPGYGYSGGPFRRLVLPLTAIAALSLLPWY